MAAKNEIVMNSVIGEGSMFEGRFYIDGSLKVDGRFQGEVKTRDQLIVGESGKVKTDITARRVVVAGTVIGNIEAEEEVHLLGTGRVLGNIRAPIVRIEEGVQIQGEVTVSAGRSGDVKHAIEEHYNEGLKLENFPEPKAIEERAEVGV